MVTQVVLNLWIGSTQTFRKENSIECVLQYTWVTHTSRRARMWDVLLGFLLERAETTTRS